MPRKYVCLICLTIFAVLLQVSSSYKIGVGIADCTGPAAGVTLMGYGKTTQKGCGIHLRQFSRAFIFDDGKKRAAFISVDAGMMSLGVRKEVLSRLNDLYGDTYNINNVILSGTHTHSAPGGFLMNFMYDVPNLGFVKDTFEALVDGITKSVARAHENMVDGKVFVASGELHGANINRSPSSYLLNPTKERERYKYDVDKEMVQLQLVSSKDNALLGVINWFAVHPTSMNYTNCLLTSDNVGYASVLLEKSRNKDHLIGKGPFVGAFASTNLGDVSPNTKGARCLNTGEVCNTVSSTCGGEGKYCVAFGPGKDMFESTQIIAEKLFEKAKILLDSSERREVTGPIRYIHKYVDMPNEKVNITTQNGTEEVHGCLPAMGYSFAAGTTDGFGENGFTQASRSSNSYWNQIRDLLFEPTEEDKQCHYPKPILINSGRIFTPYEWQPRIVPTQIIQLGEVVLIAVPGEFTTMSGRRLREVVTDAVTSHGGSPHTKAVITGLSNIYTSYVATPEEYQLQRYEGASTIYGPHTLTLYLNIYKNLAEALIKDESVSPGPSPPDFSQKLVSLTPGIMLDTSGWFHKFGDCLVQPDEVVKRGNRVIAKFVAGNPRNNLKHEKTFLSVEKLIDGDKWSVVATDADWETKFIWKKTSGLIGGSEATITWDIPEDAEPGTYRIRHFGYNKPFLSNPQSYQGTSRNFQVSK